MSNLLIYINDGLGKLGQVGAIYYALYTPTGTLDLPDDTLASQLTYAFGVKDANGKPTGNAYNCTYDQWEFFHRSTPAPGGGGTSSDPAVVKLLTELLTATKAIGTPEQQAAALLDAEAARLKS